MVRGPLAQLHVLEVEHAQPPNLRAQAQGHWQISGICPAAMPGSRRDCLGWGLGFINANVVTIRIALTITTVVIAVVIVIVIIIIISSSITIK